MTIEAAHKYIDDMDWRDIVQFARAVAVPLNIRTPVGSYKREQHDGIEPHFDQIAIVVYANKVTRLGSTIVC